MVKSNLMHDDKNINLKHDDKNSIEPYQKGDLIYQNHYVQSLIGSGIFGTVYAVKNSIGLFSAVKVINKKTRVNNDLMQQIMRVRSNQLITIENIGETYKGEYYIQMNMGEGCLSDIVLESIYTEEWVYEWFSDILNALIVFEDNGVEHLNIKLSNIFVMDDTVKIGDYGNIACFSLPEGKRMIDRTSIHYRAPESFSEKFGHSVDRWASAVVLYYLLTGEYPFDGETIEQIKDSIFNKQPNLKLIPKFASFFERCFAKDRDNRFRCAREMSNAFEDLTILKKDKQQPIYGQPKKRKKRKRCIPCR